MASKPIEKACTELNFPLTKTCFNLVHSRFEREVAKKNVPQVWSTPSFKALKRLNLFDLR